jgi:hypothetical protein
VGRAGSSGHLRLEVVQEGLDLGGWAELDVTGFDPAALGSRAELRGRLGYHPVERDGARRAAALLAELL